MLIYDEKNGGLGIGGQFSYHSQPATKRYLAHYNNLLYLNFMLKNGTMNEKTQAQKETLICERKLAYWRRHPNYDDHLANLGMQKAKKDWQLK